MVTGTQNVLFLCNCCSTTLVPSLNDQSCCSGTCRTKKAEWRQNHCHGGSSVAVVAEWRHSGRHSDRSMDAIGRSKEAQWWYKEGRRVAQIDTQCSHFLLGDQWPTTVHPFCDHGDVCAFILPPLSDLWATDLLDDLCATVLNMLKTSRRPWRPWRCLNVLCATLERPRQPFCLRSAFNGDLTSFVVAQGRHKGRSPCVKGVLTFKGRDKMAAIFQTTFPNAYSWMKMYEYQNSLKFVPRAPINSVPALVRIMAWRRPGDKPLYEPMMFCLLTHICVTRPDAYHMCLNTNPGHTDFRYFMSSSTKLRFIKQKWHKHNGLPFL